jgi:hypothetical protein
VTFIVSKGIQDWGSGQSTRPDEGTPATCDRGAAPGHIIDDLQNHARSRPALRQRVMTMIMGEKDNERREVEKLRTPFWI